jgi:hypothetical protein
MDLLWSELSGDVKTQAAEQSSNYCEPLLIHLTTENYSDFEFHIYEYICKILFFTFTGESKKKTLCGEAGTWCLRNKYVENLEM